MTSNFGRSLPPSNGSSAAPETRWRLTGKPGAAGIQLSHFKMLIARAIPAAAAYRSVIAPKSRTVTVRPCAGH